MATVLARAPVAGPASSSDSSSPASSSTTSTTKTARPPPPLAPLPLTTLMPMVSAAVSNATSSPKTMVSKEWVIPPRPKPGRKPATDTPPTKRKAQNRAAQRAFRERRAARVGELEEQLDDERRAHEQADRETREHVRRLELELQAAKSQALVLQNMLDKERQERIGVEMELGRLQAAAVHGAAEHMPEAFAQQAQPSNGGLSPNGPPLNGPSLHIPHSAASPNESTRADSCGACQPNDQCACDEAINAITQSMRGCDRCQYPSRCECIEAALDPLGPPVQTQAQAPVQVPAQIPQVPVQPHAPTLKRQLSPPPLPDEKRVRATEPADGMEIDFTATWSSRQRLPGTSSLERDDVGAGSSSAVAQQMHKPPPSDSNPVPAVATQGPAYIEFTSTGAVKLPRAKESTTKAAAATTTTTCSTSGPGTCAQCVADPNGSGRFCRMLAAMMRRDASAVGGKSVGGGCCGGRGPGGGCCKTGPQAPATAPTPTAAPDRLPGLNSRFSCAETYRTLSSHHSFGKAFDEADAWLPRLRPAVARASVAEPAARVPLEVEAASVMSVLRHFDIRFGRDC